MLTSPNAAQDPARLAPRRMSPWVTVALPLAVIAGQLVLLSIDEQLYRTWMRGELGLVENLTVAALVVAAVHAALLFSKRRHVRSRLFGPFALAMAAGCTFFAGEELSWGQHWLGFEVPQKIAERNDQGEFNLHNDPLFEKLLDQLPRTLLTLAALLGGVLAPLLRRGRSRVPDFDARTPLGWIWPDRACLVPALLAVTVSLPEKAFEAALGEAPAWADISAGETKEMCLALFLMTYLWSLYQALKVHARSEPTSA